MMEDGFPWQIGVFDAHCHVADVSDTSSTIEALRRMKANGLVVLASRAENQETTAFLAERAGMRDISRTQQNSDNEKVVPGFGWHPWFSHLLIDDRSSPLSSAITPEVKMKHYQSVLKPASDVTDDVIRDLPDPFSLAAFIAQTRHRLEQHPSAMIGEIGLDRSFRIPTAWLPQQAASDLHVPGERDGRRLSTLQVNMNHQIVVLQAQLGLAAETGRAVSLHGVQAHGTLFDVLRQTWKDDVVPKMSKKQRKLNEKGPDPHSHIVEPRNSSPRICLHSYSGSTEQLRQYLDPSIPVDLFFSFSTFNNFSKEFNKAEASVKIVPDHQLLLETDLSHAGDDLDEQLVVTARKLCELKGWDLQHGIRQLGQNWIRFVFGTSNMST